jgi:uncharacterized membrane protein YkvI
MTTFYQRYLLPGLLFQAIIIGGGYATGRELIEFFMGAGPIGGLLGMAVATVIWSAVLAVSFELVRLTQSYDYKSFFTHLLGPAWFLYEIAYLMLLVLVISVVAAAGGEFLAEAYDLPRIAGTLGLIGAVAALVFLHGEMIEKVLAGAAIALFVVYIWLIGWSLLVFGPAIEHNFASVPVGSGWFLSGVTYSAYNVACIPAVFFGLRHIKRRREAIGAGLLGGPLAMLPGVLFFIAMMAFYPEIGKQAVPSNFLMNHLDRISPNALWLHGLFEFSLLWTLVATGVGLLHAFNERIAHAYERRQRQLPRALRPLISLTIMVIAVYAAGAVGLVDLIAKGYGWLTWAFIAILVVPVLTVGVWQIQRRRPYEAPVTVPEEARARTK